MKSLLNKLKGLIKSKGPSKEDVDKATSWFKQTVNNLSGRGKSTRKDFMDSQTGTVRDIIPGMMFMFYYDPKHKKTLPFYDRFPLIILLDVKADGFTGINLHYFPMRLRALVLSRLMATMVNPFLTRNARARLSYNIINASSKLSIGKVAYKRYLSSHVRSSIIHVHPREWKHAVSLPLDIFTKKSAQHVWRDTVSKIKKGKYS